MVRGIQSSILIRILFLLNFTSLQAQNLLLNGNFEQINSCAEYHENCAPIGWRSTSEKLFGYSQTKQNNFIKLVLFKEGKSNKRKFAQTELLCPLSKGQQYEISMKIKANLFGINEICIGFSESFVYEENLDFQRIYSNKMCLDISKSVINGEWVEVKFKYLAVGNEKFACIGNLNSDEETEYVVLDKKEHKRLKKSYEPQGLIEYGIDDIKLRPINGVFCDDLEERKGSIISNTNRHTNIWEPYKKLILKEALSIETDKIVNQTPTKPINEPFIPIKKEIVLKELRFENNQHNLKDDHIAELDHLIRAMLRDKTIRIKITGHTDSNGTADYNYNLSLRRAESVRNYLAQKGIALSRMEVDGKGQTEPLMMEIDEKSRMVNRRVVVHVE